LVSLQYQTLNILIFVAWLDLEYKNEIWGFWVSTATKLTWLNQNKYTVKLGYNKLGYNEHSVITKQILVIMDNFSNSLNKNEEI